MHIYISKITIIDSDNGLLPGRRQAIIWTNAGILLIGPLGTNFSEILIKSYTFSFKKMHFKTLQIGGHFVSASMCEMQSYNSDLTTASFLLVVIFMCKSTFRDPYYKDLVSNCWLKHFLFSAICSRTARSHTPTKKYWHFGGCSGITHWGWMTHIYYTYIYTYTSANCVIVLGNGSAPLLCQVITWNNADILIAWKHPNFERISTEYSSWKCQINIGVDIILLLALLLCESMMKHFIWGAFSGIRITVKPLI